MTDGLPAHSDLGASSASRWMTCPGSVRLIREARAAGMTESRSEYAAEGTAAHMLAEICLTNGDDALDHAGTVIKADGYEFEVDEDMCEAVQVFLDAVRGDLTERTTIFIEKRFHLKDLDVRFFGTNDAGIYDPDKKLLRVYDYKHGRGVPVSVIDNKQLKYYALGAMHDIQDVIAEIELVIVQPRFEGGDPVQRWRLPAVDLYAYAGDLIMAAQATDADDAPLVPDFETPTDHCRFCPVGGICEARAKAAYETAVADFDDFGGMTLMEPQDIGENIMPVLLERAGRLEDWIKAVKQHAHTMAENGRPPAGWKLVEKRAQRKWTMEPSALEAWFDAQGYTEDEIFTKKLASPAQFEKVIGKKQFEALNEKFKLAEQRSSGVVLAPESDKRPGVDPKNCPEAAFGDG